MTRTSMRAGVAVLAIAGALCMAGGAWSDEPGPDTIEHATPALKRIAPPDVPPVTVGGVRVEALPWGRERGFGQNGGYVAAIDPATGAELWTLKIYDVPYDGVMEEDVQDVFIASMSALGDDRVEIVDEDGRRYVLDVAARRATRP